MTTAVTELSWAELFFGETHFYAELDNADIYALQWHEVGSTLYISIKDKSLIDIRMEREVHEVKYLRYQDIGLEKVAVVAFKILPHRPLLWAKGTALVGGWGDRSQIVVQIVVDDSEAVKKYRRFCEWMDQNVFPGGARYMDQAESRTIWKYANRDFIEVNDMNEEDEVDINRIILTRFKICLSLRDVRKTSPGEWANDSIVEYGLKKKHQEGCHIMSPFCYVDVKQGGTGNIKKWVANINIFEFDYVIIPINPNGRHWCLAIIDHPGKLVVDSNVETSVDSGPGKRHSTSSGSSVDGKNTTSIDSDTMNSTIYIMDSLPCGHSRELFKFMDDLIIHAKDKIEKPIDTDRIRHIEAKMPQQVNSDDCGYYMMHFAHVFMEQPGKSRELLADDTSDHEEHWNNMGEAKRKRAWVCKSIRDDMEHDGVLASNASTRKALDSIMFKLGQELS